jgi:hypothetical protein
MFSRQYLRLIFALTLWTNRRGCWAFELVRLLRFCNAQSSWLIRRLTFTESRVSLRAEIFCIRVFNKLCLDLFCSEIISQVLISSVSISFTLWCNKVFACRIVIVLDQLMPTHFFPAKNLLAICLSYVRVFLVAYLWLTQIAFFPTWHHWDPLVGGLGPQYFWSCPLKSSDARLIFWTIHFIRVSLLRLSNGSLFFLRDKNKILCAGKRCLSTFLSDSVEITRAGCCCVNHISSKDLLSSFFLDQVYFRRVERLLLIHIWSCRAIRLSSRYMTVVLLLKYSW